MANLTMNRTDKLIFNNDLTADTYYTEDSNNVLQRFLSNTRCDEAQIYGSAGTTDRAVVIRANGQALVAFPVDLTSAAIQKAIDNLGSGGVVQLLVGTYTISSTVKFTNNIIIRGCGAATKLAPSTSLASAILQSDSTSAQRSGVFIRDLVIDNLDYSTAGGVGIDFTRVSNGGIKNVQIANVETGVLLKGHAYYNLLEQLIVTTVAIRWVLRLQTAIA